MAAVTIEDLFRRHWPLVLGYLTRQTRDAHLAEEIAQETFVRATRAFLGYQDGSPAAWLLTIARHSLIDHVRKHGRTVVVAEMPEELSLGHLEDDGVRDALERLPDRPRRLLTLHYFDRFTYSEIAAMTESTEAAVKAAIHRARQQFALEYQKEHADV